MTLFLSLLPIYIFGNLHCLGMCGPLVMLLGRHRYRLFYLLGRIVSFTCAGLVAGGSGALLYGFLKEYRLAESLSLFSGALIMGLGCAKLFNVSFHLRQESLPLFVRFFHQWSATLLLKDSKISTFLFGFFSIALPCGQTLLVFSACALFGSALSGLINGCLFALFTTPSLFIAMHALRRFKSGGFDRWLLSGSAILVGLLTICRGCAEMGWMEHWIINPKSDAAYHIIIF